MQDTIYVIWLGIANKFLDTDVSDIYYEELQLIPNPVFDKLSLNIEEVLTDDWEYEIHSADGKIIRSLVGKNSIDAIDVEGLNKGLYFLILHVGKKQYLGKYFKI